jgi:transposase
VDPCKKNAKKHRAVIVFVDETGVSLRPYRVRTWAPRGQTPTLQYSFNWKNLSIIGGITFRSIYFRTFPGTIHSHEVILFLGDLFRHLKRKVVLVWDRLPVHRSRAVQEFLRGFPQVTLEYLPPYAPDLNPMEYVWGIFKKNGMANFCPEYVTELSRRARKELGRLRRRKGIIASCWAQSKLPL